MADTQQRATNSMKAGKADLKSVGALAFAPEGVLLAADSIGGAVFALDTGDTKPGPAGKLAIANLGEKVAAMLGAAAGEISIRDMAVNPLSGNVYLSIGRGRGADAAPVILRSDRAGNLSELSLDNIKHAAVSISDGPAADAVDARGNKRRVDTITDLGFVDGKVIVAGISNEEFSSVLRAYDYPFTGETKGANIEIYHGAHGRYETNAPIRTFMAYEIDGRPSILATFTCTPLVKIPVSALTPGAKVKATTIAELGNMNRPLDMIAYKQAGHDYILLANSHRGLMKIEADNLEQYGPITEHVKQTKGVPYTTVDALKGVTRLAKLDDGAALVMIADGDNTALQTIALP
jgi:hypothetical protein